MKKLLFVTVLLFGFALQPVLAQEGDDAPQGGLFSGDVDVEEATDTATEGGSDLGDKRAQIVALDEALDAYEKGNFAVAYRGFFPLARKGHAAAQEIVGIMYLNGQGIDIDEDAAAKWLKKSAVQGRPLAMHYLGTMYENGLGVEQDSVKALMWLELAVSNYPAGEKKDRAMLDRDNVALGISDNQKQRAREMQKEWISQHMSDNNVESMSRESTH